MVIHMKERNLYNKQKVRYGEHSNNLGVVVNTNLSVFLSKNHEHSVCQLHVFVVVMNPYQVGYIEAAAGAVYTLSPQRFAPCRRLKYQMKL